MTELEQRARVVEIARSWVGTPYHHRARIKGVGVDCGQLIAGVFEEAGLIEPVPLEKYPPDWMMHQREPRFVRRLEVYARKVDRPARPGDIVLFRWGFSPSHGGIVLEWPLIVHALLKEGRVTLASTDQEEMLRDKFSGAWTLKGWD